MTSQAPASMPAWNGGRSPAVSAARLWPSTGSASWLFDRGVAVAREVLEGGGHAGRLQPAHRRRDLRGDRRRVAAVRAGADHRVAGRADHVGVRGEVDVDADRGEFGAGGPPGRLGQVGPAGRAERHRAGQLHQPGLDPGHPAVLLVGADEQVGLAGRRGAEAARRRCSASVRARTWAAAAPAPAFSDVAHQDHAAEVVLRDQLGRRSPAGRRRSIEGIEHLADQVDVAESRRPAAAARSAGLARRRRVVGSPDRRRYRQPASGATRASDRRDRGTARRGRGAHRSTFTHRRSPIAPVSPMPIRDAARQLDLGEPGRGRALAGVPVRLQLGVPGGAEQPVQRVRRSPRCRARWPARRAPGPRVIMRSPVTLTAARNRPRPGTCMKRSPSYAGAGLLGDLEPEHRPAAQGGDELGARAGLARTRCTRPAGSSGRPAGRTTPGGPASRGRARSPTRRGAPRRAGPSARIRHHGLARSYLLRRGRLPQRPRLQRRGTGLSYRQSADRSTPPPG